MIYLIVQKVQKYELKSWYVTVLSFAIFIMALVSRPEMIDHMVRKGGYKRDFQEMSSGKQHLHALMIDLMQQYEMVKRKALHLMKKGAIKEYIEKLEEINKLKFELASTSKG